MLKKVACDTSYPKSDAGSYSAHPIAQTLDGANKRALALPSEARNSKTLPALRHNLHAITHEADLPVPPSEMEHEREQQNATEAVEDEGAAGETALHLEIVVELVVVVVVVEGAHVDDGLHGAARKLRSAHAVQDVPCRVVRNAEQLEIKQRQRWQRREQPGRHRAAFRSHAGALEPGSGMLPSGRLMRRRDKSGAGKGGCVGAKGRRSSLFLAGGAHLLW